MCTETRPGVPDKQRDDQIEHEQRNAEGQNFQCKLPSGNRLASKDDPLESSREYGRGEHGKAEGSESPEVTERWYQTGKHQSVNTHIYTLQYERLIGMVLHSQEVIQRNED